MILLNIFFDLFLISAFSQYICMYWISIIKKLFMNSCKLIKAFDRHQFSDSAEFNLIFFE